MIGTLRMRLWWWELLPMAHVAATTATLVAPRLVHAAARTAFALRTNTSAQ